MRPPVILHDCICPVYSRLQHTSISLLATWDVNRDKSWRSSIYSLSTATNATEMSLYTPVLAQRITENCQKCSKWHNVISAKCSHVQCKHVAQWWDFYTHQKIHFPQWHFFFYIPFMQPGNLSFRALSKTAGDTQFPRTPFTPSIGVGTVSCLFVVEMTVLLSTLATSAGSVLANQLHTQNITFILNKRGRYVFI